MNKTVIIFGATGKIGSEVVKKFLQTYGHLILVARSRSKVNQLVKGCLAEFPNKVIIPIILKSNYNKSLQSCLKSLPSYCQRLAIVNLIASQQPTGPIWDNKIQSWEHTLKLNLMLNVAIVSESIRYAVAHQLHTSIVLFSGGGAAYARPNFSAYAVSKTGVLRLVENTAEELKLYGYDDLVQINAVAPGQVKSSLTKEILDAGAGVVGEKAYSEAMVTWQKGGVSPLEAAELTYALSERDINAGLSGRLIHVKEPYPEYFKKVALINDTAQGLLRREQFK